MLWKWKIFTYFHQFRIKGTVVVLQLAYTFFLVKFKCMKGDEKLQGPYGPCSHCCTPCHL